MDTIEALLIGVGFAFLVLITLVVWDLIWRRRGLHLLRRYQRPLVYAALVVAFLGFCFLGWRSIRADKWNQYNPNLGPKEGRRFAYVLLGLQVYASENDGVYPYSPNGSARGLWLIYPNSYPDHSVLLAKDSNLPPPNTKPVPAIYPASTWVVYRQGYGSESGSVVVLYAKRSVNGKRWVAQADGEILELTEAELEQLLLASEPSSEGQEDASPSNPSD